MTNLPDGGMSAEELAESLATTFYASNEVQRHVMSIAVNKIKARDAQLSQAKGEEVGVKLTPERAKDLLQELRSANDGCAITVWKNGTWKEWQTLDAKYAEQDPDFFVTIPLNDAKGELPEIKDVAAVQHHRPDIAPDAMVCYLSAPGYRQMKFDNATIQLNFPTCAMRVLDWLHNYKLPLGEDKTNV